MQTANIVWKNSKSLILDAKNYNYNPKISIKIYLKICIKLLEKAQWFNAQQNNKLMAFTYYYRYLDLCLVKLSNHPQIKCSGSNYVLEKYDDNMTDLELYRKQYKQLIDLEIPIVLKIIEDLKFEIDSIFNKQQSSLANSISTIKKNHNTNSENSTKPNITTTSFNQNRFNQSIDFFNTTNNLSTNITGTTNTNNFDGIRANDDNVNNDNSNNNNESTNSNELMYPELPQLSFPTF